MTDLGPEKLVRSSASCVYQIVTSQTIGMSYVKLSKSGCISDMRFCAILSWAVKVVGKTQ